MMLGGSLGFGVERIVIFSLRAAQSHDVTARESKGMNAYMQSTIAMGFIAICQDVVNLLRTALVNSTLPSSDCNDSHLKKAISESSTPSLITFQVVEVDSTEEDRARRRFWYRRLSDLLYVGFLGALVPGITGNSDYGTAVEKPSEKTLVFRLRYASSAVALFFSMALAATAVWAAASVPRFRKSAAYLTLFICTLFSITTIYRLGILWTETTSLISTAPGSQNTPGEKAAFYILHIVPEWISVLVLLSCNVRDVFGTGMFGDTRFRDETEREKDIKEANQLYKYDKRTGEGVGIYDEDFGMLAKIRRLWRRKG